MFFIGVGYNNEDLILYPISTENDNIKLTPFRDIFKSMRGASEEVKNPQRQRPMGNFSYMDDYDAWK